MSNKESEVYPMSMFPTFEVSDIRTSIEWYTGVMRFVLIYEMPDTEGRAYMAHIRKEKHQDLMLVTRQDHKYDDVIKYGAGVSVTFQYTGNDKDHFISIDDYASRIRGMGANILKGPVNTPWNTRELIVADPDGYHLIFSALRGEASGDQSHQSVNNADRILFKSN